MIRNWLLPVIIGLIAAALAWQGTLMATPYVLMSKAMEKVGGRAPVNSFGFGEPSTADNQPIVRPSPDLVYSTCVFDLSHGPLSIEVEPVPGTYWSLSIFDAQTNVAKVLSDRDTGGKAARLRLTRDGWMVKERIGFADVPLKHDKGIALIRILLDGPSRYTEIDAIRRKATCNKP